MPLINAPDNLKDPLNSNTSDLQVYMDIQKATTDIVKLQPLEDPVWVLCLKVPVRQLSRYFVWKCLSDHCLGTFIGSACPTTV